MITTIRIPRAGALFLLAAMIGLLLVLSFGPAFPAEAPSNVIDMTVPLHDERGETIKDAGTRKAGDDACDKCLPLTRGRAIANALFAPDHDASGADLWSRGVLADRVRDDKAATLTADEVATIKKLLAKGYPSPVLIMQLYPVLDPNAKPGDVK